MDWLLPPPHLLCAHFPGHHAARRGPGLAVARVCGARGHGRTDLLRRGAAVPPRPGAVCPTLTQGSGHVTWGVAHLSVNYGGVAAVTDASLDVVAGEVVALVGGDGAGKTTLLRTIAGSVRATSG